MTRYIKFIVFLILVILLALGGIKLLKKRKEELAIFQSQKNLFI